MDRPHKITMYDGRGNKVNVHSFRYMEDASRTYANICKVIKDNPNSLDKGVKKIALSTVYSETHI